ncbi:hypothetical protein GH714_019075 [Hevea brasiliensis]|uniref:Zinc finger PMZ-type domain-containing protein n=1 Tax=Hevea brasiliensis TaxID=3981 RepID=A0A6A6L9D2_HEVBR|nr:hypothetical protein GH714_019075 [Hevea brasiliensis]
MGQNISSPPLHAIINGVPSQFSAVKGSTPDNVERDMPVNTMGKGMAVNIKGRGLIVPLKGRGSSVSMRRRGSSVSIRGRVTKQYVDDSKNETYDPMHRKKKYTNPSQGMYGDPFKDTDGEDQNLGWPFIGLDGCHLKGPYGAIFFSIVVLDGEYEVHERPCKFVASLEKRTCGCGWWNIIGLPCKDSARAIGFIRGNIEEYYDDYYCIACYLRVYAGALHLVPQKDIELDDVYPPMLPPP